MAHFSSLSPHKEKLPKHVIFHDFFKLLLGGLRWSCRYVEMFLGPLEGVLSLRQSPVTPPHKVPKMNIYYFFWVFFSIFSKVTGVIPK